jgi:hypothetical protein
MARKTAEGEKNEAQQNEKLVDEREETDALTEALEDSFPASDPPAMTQPRKHATTPQTKKKTT